MKTKVILEIGCNHQGSIETAKEMIIEAARLGVYGVKFQKRDIDSIPEEIGAAPRDPVHNFGETYREHRAALEFTFMEIRELKEYAENLGLMFSCSAFDIESLKGLLLCGVQNIKFPSQLLLNEDLYRAFREFKNTDTKLFVSSGMHREKEIDLAFEGYGVDIDVFYHCISIYPAKSKYCNMNVIKLFNLAAKVNKIKLGYSSHEKDGEAIPYAVAAGATYIERHFTLSKSWRGHDHSTVSSEPEEIEKIMNEIKHVEMIMGDGVRVLSAEEKNTARKFRGDYEND